MNKNIKQNYFGQVRKVLGKVEKSEDAASHFRCIVLMGDSQKKEAYSFIHAPQEDLTQLVLEAMRNSEQFTYATACALESYDKELRNGNKSTTR